MQVGVLVSEGPPGDPTPVLVPGLELVASRVPCMMSCSLDSGAATEAVLWEAPAARRREEARPSVSGEGGGLALGAPSGRHWQPWPWAIPVSWSLTYQDEENTPFKRLLWGQGTVGNTRENILDDVLTALPFLPIFIA